MGAEARIDMRSSKDWLKEKTSQWNFPVNIKVRSHKPMDACFASQENDLPLRKMSNLILGQIILNNSIIHDAYDNIDFKVSREALD